MRLLYSQTGERSAISLWFDNTHKTVVKEAHCFGCGHVIFQYYNDLLIAVPGHGPLEDVAPVAVVQCRNSVCKMVYHLYRGEQ